MLKELFEASFYITFPKKEGAILMLNERIVQGDFVLIDSHACQNCQYVCNVLPEEREQLKVHGKSLVSILALDQVFGYVREDVGEICDYLLDGKESVILIEMTCSASTYVNSKRMKARNQLLNTLSLLYTNPDVKKHIEKKKHCYVVFSWKETIDENPDNVESSMKGMVLMADEIYSPDNESNFDFGFKLKEIRYPDMLVCQ